MDDIIALVWPSHLCGVGRSDRPLRWRGTEQTPHNRSGYSVRRNSISPASSFHGWLFSSSSTSQLASALAFISRSTSAYTFVVASDTCPSHARIVLMSTPDRSRCVAVVWRIVCGLTRFFVQRRHSLRRPGRAAFHQGVDAEPRQRSAAAIQKDVFGWSTATAPTRPVRAPSAPTAGTGAACSPCPGSRPRPGRGRAPAARSGRRCEPGPLRRPGRPCCTRTAARHSPDGPGRSSGPGPRARHPSPPSPGT